MKGMTLEAVAKACDGIYHGSDGDKIKEVSAITTDSRQIQPQECLLRLRVQEVTGMLILIPVMKRSALLYFRAGASGREKTVHSGRILTSGIKRHCAVIPRQSGYQSGRYYGKCRKDQYKGNDCSSSFTEVQSIKDTGQLQ